MRVVLNKTKFDTGDILYSPFTHEKVVYIIETGYVMAYTYDDDGKRRIYLIYGPGSYFPILTTFNDSEQRATYEALTKVTATKYSKEQFLQKISTDTKFCNQILAKTVDQLATFADRVMDLQITKLEDRIINQLEILTKQHGIKKNGEYVLPYKLKHHHIADLLGVERESVSRALGRIHAKDIVAQ